MQMAQVPGRDEPSAEGEVNYDYVVSYLESLGYKGWMGAEYIPAGGEFNAALLSFWKPRDTTRDSPRKNRKI